jgi:hypothetical protein
MTDGCSVSFAIPFDELTVRFSVGFNQQSIPAEGSLHVQSVGKEFDKKSVWL